MDKVKTRYILRIVLKLLLIIILAYIDLALLCAPFYDPNENLGGGYRYCYEQSHISGPKITIPSAVLNYAYDNRFIMAKQRLGLQPSRDYSDFYEYNFPYLNCTYYWIIDKETDKYYGPLFFEDFRNKCDSLKIGLTFDKDREKKIELETTGVYVDGYKIY